MKIFVTMQALNFSSKYIGKSNLINTLLVQLSVLLNMSVIYVGYSIYKILTGGELVKKPQISNFLYKKGSFPVPKIDLRIILWILPLVLSLVPIIMFLYYTKDFILIAATVNHYYSSGGGEG